MSSYNETALPSFYGLLTKISWHFLEKQVGDLGGICPQKTPWWNGDNEDYIVIDAIVIHISSRHK